VESLDESKACLAGVLGALLELVFVSVSDGSTPVVQSALTVMQEASVAPSSSVGDRREVESALHESP